MYLSDLCLASHVKLNKGCQSKKSKCFSLLFTDACSHLTSTTPSKQAENSLSPFSPPCRCLLSPQEIEGSPSFRSLQDYWGMQLHNGRLRMHFSFPKRSDSIKSSLPWTQRLKTNRTLSLRLITAQATVCNPPAEDFYLSTASTNLFYSHTHIQRHTHT